MALLAYRCGMVGGVGVGKGVVVGIEAAGGLEGRHGCFDFVCFLFSVFSLYVEFMYLHMVGRLLALTVHTNNMMYVSFCSLRRLVCDLS